MKIIIKNNPLEVGKAAGKAASILINEAIRNNGQANIILATGACQMETLDQLITEEIEWNKVIMFQLNEYVGLPKSSTAGCRKYLKDRFIKNISGLKKCYMINGVKDPVDECRRLSEVIKKFPIGTEARNKKAKPILITPVTRRKFDDSGNIQDVHVVYSAIVREVALEYKVPLIDLNKKSQKLLQDLGSEKSKSLFLAFGENPYYPKNEEDITHFNALGARKIAEIVLAELQALKVRWANRKVE